MRTPAQTAASRSNGAKSKGPVTARGKRNSSRNALRHGLFAETLVLEAEDPAQFLELVTELWEEHDPQTATEEMLVYIIAAAHWKQTRIWGMQKVALDYDISHPPAGPPALSPLRAILALRASPDSVRTPELLLRSETAADRQISRALHRLQQLQEKRMGQNVVRSSPAERTRQPIENQIRITPNAILTQSHPTTQGRLRPAQHETAKKTTLLTTIPLQKTAQAHKFDAEPSIEFRQHTQSVPRCIRQTPGPQSAARLALVHPKIAH